MAVLSIRWESTSRVTPETAAVTTPAEGEEVSEEIEEAQKPMADKAMLVYIVDESVSNEFDKVESVILTDDKVAVGTKAFRCIKVPSSQAESDPLLADNGRETPRFVLITPDYETVKVVEGSRLSVSGLYSAMKSVAKKSYEQNFDKNIRELVRLLNEFDKINNERGLLDAKVERMGDKVTPSDERKIAREREELAERETEANEARDELLTFELKATA